MKKSSTDKNSNSPKTSNKTAPSRAKSESKIESELKSKVKAKSESRIDGEAKTPSEIPKFAKGLCFKKLFFIFLIGSVFGAIYEDILVFFKTLFETGTGEWMLHRGVIYGPLNVIYGFGAALMCWILLRKPYDNWQTFFIAAGVGGLTEYLLSFFQELVTHTTSWDYHGLWLNLNGRTTIPFMAFWGILGLALVKYIYPFVSRLIENIPVRTGEILFTVLFVFVIFDMAVSWSALVRRALRHYDIPAFTPIGEFYDYHYSDEFLVKYFPNMNWAD